MSKNVGLKSFYETRTVGLKSFYENASREEVDALCQSAGVTIYAVRRVISGGREVCLKFSSSRGRKYKFAQGEEITCWPNRQPKLPLSYTGRRKVEEVGLAEALKLYPDLGKSSGASDQMMRKAIATGRAKNVYIGFVGLGRSRQKIEPVYALEKKPWPQRKRAKK